LQNFLKQFGGKITEELTQQYMLSENWKNGSFQNLEETALAANLRDIPRMLYKQFSNNKERTPKVKLPVASFQKETFLSPSDTSKFIWYGHSVILMRMENRTILIDPMFGPDTTPIAPMTTHRFSENTINIIDQLPEIDLILLTHDHYDHLDYQSIQKLKHKAKKYFVALGVKRHLEAWGISPNLITEFDWWQDYILDNIKITFTPTRHFSGRGLTDRLKSLWGGWVFQSTQENIWFSGDSGYGKHFEKIGKKFNGFDFAFMECGQYNQDWHDLHMFPEESVQAAIDAKVIKAMPVHWGGFALSYQHTWSEPPTQFIQFAEEKQLDYSVPRIGEIFDVATIRQKLWWEDLL